MKKVRIILTGVDVVHVEQLLCKLEKVIDSYGYVITDEKKGNPKTDIIMWVSTIEKYWNGSEWINSAMGTICVEQKRFTFQLYE